MNKLPSCIKFLKHLDGKLHSHLEWPYAKCPEGIAIPGDFMPERGNGEN